MTYSSNIPQTLIVTIYTYIVYGLYRVTILSLLRLSIYIKLLYVYWFKDISNEVYYLPSLISTANRFFKTSEEFLRQTHKTRKSQSFMSFASQYMSRDISRVSNEL